MTNKTPLASRYLKVNHAGENGAVNIYKAQILVSRLLHPKLVQELTHFQAHEENHREIFKTELHSRGVRRCRSYFVCGLGGYVLGLITALLGKNAIAATTVAVEKVVLIHLEHQISKLTGKDDNAVKAISSIVVEEKEHRDHFTVQNNRLIPILTYTISTSTKIVIWLVLKL